MRTHTKVVLGGMVTTLVGVAGAYALLRTPSEGEIRDAERPPVFAQAEAAPVLAPPSRPRSRRAIPRPKSKSPRSVNGRRRP